MTGMAPQEAAWRLLGGCGALEPPRRLAGGRVNESYRLRVAGRSLLLQRINPSVFPEPALVTANLLRAVRHLYDALARRAADDTPWRWPEPVAGADGAWSLADTDGAHWRLLRFIPATHARLVLHDAAAAFEMGCCLGSFHMLLADADPAVFADTLPGFHCLDRYLADYDVMSGKTSPPARSDLLAWCQGQIQVGRLRADLLLELAAKGSLRRQVVHGDPKVGNFLFSRSHPSRVLALIDFDTVKAGLVLHDLGDCLRSVANPAGESRCASRLRLDLCQALLSGYFSRARGLLSPADFATLPLAPWSMAYELGLRFLTDHLAGDGYFHVRQRGDNLRRARSQLQLAARFQADEEMLARSIRRAEAGSA